MTRKFNIINNKTKGFSTVRIVGIVFLVLAGILSLSFTASGSSILGSRYKETSPETSIGSGGSINGCEIPANYAAVFNAAVADYSVSPALIAAIFYAGEHGKSWPPITGPWADGIPTSTGRAKGPFQFKDGTWVRYGLGGNVQDINDAAKGAANMFEQNIAAGKGNLEHKIRNAIANYNSSDEYVETVYAQYLEFQQCVTQPLSEGGGDSSQVPIDGHVFPLAHTTGFGGDWLANRCSGTGSGQNHAHGGTDLMHKRNDEVPVYAIVDGYIFSRNSSSLRLVSTNPNDHYTYYYTHLSRITVSKGDSVKAGQLIGNSGGYSGGAQGDHTHIGMLTSPENRVEVPISTCKVGQSERALSAQKEGIINPIPFLKKLQPQ